MGGASAQSSPGKQLRAESMEPPAPSESPIVPPAQPFGRQQSDPAPPQSGYGHQADLAIRGLESARAQVKTPEPRGSKDGLRGVRKEFPQVSPSTPGHLPPFDWDDFEARYEQVLAQADAKEEAHLKEFQQLVEYFNVWAAAASVHDTERAVKRLQTRERYVRISEQTLSQKKKHLTEVVRAFQSALALLSQP